LKNGEKELSWLSWVNVVEEKTEAASSEDKWAMRRLILGKWGAQVWMHFLLNLNFFCVIGFEHVGKTGSQRFAWIRGFTL
jgi:hypothetical protein